jgi:hypothetical protein
MGENSVGKRCGCKKNTRERSHQIAIPSLEQKITFKRVFRTRFPVEVR